MVRRKPRILVDCDGVLTDFLARYLGLHRKLNGRDCNREQHTNYDFSKCLATAEEDERIWRHFDVTPGLVADLPLIDGAIAALDELRTMGEVICVTSPHLGGTWCSERFAQLKRLGFTRRSVVFAADKALIPGDYLIDDKLDNCLEWSRAHLDGLSILFDQPHNQAWADDATVMRAKGWPDALRILREELGQ